MILCPKVSTFSFDFKSDLMKDHWDNIYKEKSDRDLSWYQEYPETSLKLIDELKLKITDPIIDVGGGNSNLAYQLNLRGYTDLSVLEISGVSIRKMQLKLEDAAENIKWIASNVLDFEPEKKYKLWHDRAVFHFLIPLEDKIKYKSRLISSLDKNGYFILSTFSSDGPARCSGLEVCQYDLASLRSIFDDAFELLNVFNEDHITRSGNAQNFIFSVWKKSK